MGFFPALALVLIVLKLLGVPNIAWVTIVILGLLPQIVTTLISLGIVIFTRK